MHLERTVMVSRPAEVVFDFQLQPASEATDERRSQRPRALQVQGA